MQALLRLFTKEIPKDLRIKALTALTTAPLGHDCWIDSRGRACALVAAAYGAANKPIHPDIKVRQKDLAAMLGGIRVKRLRAAWHEWDMTLNDAGRARFVQLMRIELETLLVFEKKRQQTSVGVHQTRRSARREVLSV